MKPYNPVERIKELELEIKQLKAREADLLQQIEAVKLFIQQLVAGLQKTDSLS